MIFIQSQTVYKYELQVYYIQLYEYEYRESRNNSCRLSENPGVPLPDPDSIQHWIRGSLRVPPGSNA